MRLEWELGLRLRVRLRSAARGYSVARTQSALSRRELTRRSAKQMESPGPPQRSFREDGVRVVIGVEADYRSHAVDVLDEIAVVEH